MKVKFPFPTWREEDSRTHGRLLRPMQCKVQGMRNFSVSQGRDLKKCEISRAWNANLRGVHGTRVLKCFWRSRLNNVNWFEFRKGGFLLWIWWNEQSSIRRNSCSSTEKRKSVMDVEKVNYLFTVPTAKLFQLFHFLVCSILDVMRQDELQMQYSSGQFFTSWVNRLHSVLKKVRSGQLS
jgi:hypothetical protein